MAATSRISSTRSGVCDRGYSTTFRLDHGNYSDPERAEIERTETVGKTRAAFGRTAAPERSRAPSSGDTEDRTTRRDSDERAPAAFRTSVQEAVFTWRRRSG